MSANLNLEVTEDRLKDVPLEVFYFVDTNPKHMIQFVAHFVVDESGNYLPLAEAAKLVYGGRTLADIEDLVTLLREKMEEKMVPKA